MTESVLSCRSLTMSFPGTLALDAVDFDIAPGEVHALVGQNGSGKSTMIKVLAGYYVPTDDSRVAVNGRVLKFGSAEESRNAGLRFVHQDLGLIPDLNTVENMALTNGYASSPGRPIKWQQERRRAQEAIEKLGYDFDVTRPVSTLAPAERTGVAVARSLDGWQDGAQVLVFDEPTAALPKPEADRLFQVIRRIRDSGVAILYVSHHLDEILRISDRVTALRGGKRVATVERANLDHDGLIELIVGRNVASAVPGTAEKGSGTALLHIGALSGVRLDGLNLDVRAGEVVGLAGLAGSGREEFASLVFGAAGRTGEVAVQGQSLKPNRPTDAVAHGLALIPADRKGEGIFAGMAVRENLVVSSLRKGVLRRPIRLGSERSDALSWMKKLSVSPSQTEIPIAALSGGNQQKVLIAKWLRTSPKVLLLDEPTQGVDVGSRAEIYREISAAAASGCGVVVCSSDSQELVQICNRVLVLVRGRVAVELIGSDINADAIDAWCLSTTRTEESLI